MKPNELTELFAEDRAVSPVVGVALLIAITVILAAVIGGVVLGLGTGGVDTPQAQMQLDHNSTAQEANISHNGGEPLDSDQIIVGINGANDYELEDDLTAGGSVLIVQDDGTSATVEEDDEVTVLWEDPNSDSTTVLENFEA